MDAIESPRQPVARRITVRGRVQGVGYRWFARQTAHTLGVTGWVRNMPDGCVLLEVAAPEDALARFAAELRAGPPGSHVVDVRVEARDGGEPLPDRFVVIR